MANLMINDEMATKNYKRFQEGQSYLGKKGLLNSIPECVKFFEGNQWASVTQATKHIPRPVINFVSKIVNNKASNILGAPIHLNFRADSDEGSTEKFTKFAEYQMKEMQMEYYDFLACYDGLVKGTYCYYFYWDENAIGKRGIKEGSLRCETIDPLNIVVSNPMETDVQKQQYIIVKTREDIDSIKAICKKQNKEKIVPDDLESKYDSDIESENNNFVTVYTRFFRKDGEVYFEKSTRYCDIHDAIPMNPLVLANKLKKKTKKDNENHKDVEIYEIDAPQEVNMDSTIEDETESGYEEKQFTFNLYPFEIGCLQPKDKCIYGISEVEGLIENQKAVNFQLSMILLNSQQLGWGKYLVKDGALKGQKITNQPGQVLVDHSPYGSWGIKPMEGQQFSNGAFELLQSVIELSRTVTNSSDIITGDMVSKDLSGTAIAQIQAQGQKPIEQMQKRFWRSKEKIGKILEIYYKLFYENSSYSYEISEDEYTLREEQMYEKAKQENYRGKMPVISRSSEGIFNGEDFIKTPFNIVVEAGKGTQYSEIMQMDFANNLILNGNINNISSENLELLIEMYPTSAIPNKAELKRFIRQREQSQIAQLQQELESVKQQASTLLQQAQQELSKKNVEVKSLSEYVKALNKEYGNKINTANSELNNMRKFMQNQKVSSGNEETTTDTSTKVNA